MDKTIRYVVPIIEVQKFIVECMINVQCTLEHAQQLADLLIEADIRGHYSHGLNRLKIYIEDVETKSCSGNGVPKVIKKKGATAWVDGDNALGVVVGNFCTELAMELALEHGIGWVVAKNSNHFGMAAYYPLRMAKKENGFVGLAFTNSSPIMIPTRAEEPSLGTNPLSVVATAKNEDNFALDMATSVIALGKVEIAEKKNQNIPKGWALDNNGNGTENPKEVKALLPLGGDENTSTGLGMMVELFCGIFAGAKFGKSIRPWRELSETANLGQCFVAIDPECFAPGFAERLQDLLDGTRNLKPKDENKPVLVPGDLARLNIQLSQKHGGIIYEKYQIENLKNIAQERKIELFSFKEVSD